MVRNAFYQQVQGRINGSIFSNGRAGFIGSHIVDHAWYGHQVLDDGTSSGNYVQNIQDSNLSLMHASIMDPQALDEACCGVDMFCT